MEPKSCFQCALMDICKFADRLQGLAPVIDIRELAKKFPLNCNHFTKIEEGN